MAVVIDQHAEDGFLPGQALQVKRMMTRFGCAHGTARAALSKLRQRGLVLAPREQWIVADGASQIAQAATTMRAEVRGSEILEVLELRRTLEGLAARRAAEVYDRSAHYAHHFKAVQVRLNKAKGNIAEEIAADRAFHDQIYTLAGSEVLHAVLSQLRRFLHVNIGDNVASLYTQRACLSLLFRLCGKNRCGIKAVSGWGDGGMADDLLPNFPPVIS